MSDFAKRYPRVWHVMEAEGAGCAVLHPAAALRRLAEQAATEQAGAEQAEAGHAGAGHAEDGLNRGDFQRLSLPGGLTAVLRLQLMPDARLGPILGGRFAGCPGLWRGHIDRHVFFWVSPDRRDRFAAACARLRARGAMGAGAAPVAIELETAALLATHGRHAFFSTINSGSVLRGGARTRRDENTLRPVAAWRGERAVELAIRASVPLPVHAVSSLGIPDFSSPNARHGPGRVSA